MSDAVPAAEPRSALRLCADETLWPQQIARIDDALRSGIAVEFCFARSDVEPWAVLIRSGGVIRIYGAGGAHVGTFASADAAVSHGWIRGGWAGTAGGGA